MAAIIKHPHLGSVQGVLKDGVIQFLGIKYGLLQGRFAQPELMVDYGGSVDATKFGPTVLTPPLGCDFEFSFIQQSLEKPEFPGMSDLDGLNLNITVPSGVKDKDKLPVVVFVHGGGMAIGGNWWPQYDFARLVRLSAAKGKPIIGVGINYRLGVPGFLTSAALQAKGYPSNRGLLDQRVAFKWLAKNIAGFGGNPDNITAMGESAGGVSVILALNSQEPLFKRVFSLSGTGLTFPVLPPPVVESTYQGVMHALGLSDVPVDQQPDRLRATSPLDLVLKIGPTLPLLPTLDPITMPQPPTFKALSSPEMVTQIPGYSWCESLMIGSCEFDGSIFAAMGIFKRGSVAQSFISSLENTLSSNKVHVDAILKQYNITPQTPDNEAEISIIHFATDVVHFAAALTYAKSFPGKSYVYQFDEPNPWDGPYKGRSTHILDVAFIFQNYEEKMDDRQKKVAVAFAEDLFTFSYGEDPFPSFKHPMEARLYGPSDKSTKRYGPVKKLDAASGVEQLWEEVGLDNLLLAWNMYMSGH